MKRITALIRPFTLDRVREALAGLGISGLTVAEVKGFGQQQGHTEQYRAAEYQVDYLPKIQMDLVVEDSLVDPVLEAIVQAARSGKIGDGKIFVSPVERVVRIRTGERDEAAL